MKWVFLFLFCPLYSYSQAKIGIHGSYIIAAIGKDGIILAGDSRANIYNTDDKNQSPIAYFDSVQKIFLLNDDVALGSMGSGIISNVFFDAIVNKFRASEPNQQPGKIIGNFLKYCKEIMPLEAYTQITNNELISIGYKNNTPTICAYSKRDGIDTCINYGFICGDGLSDFDSMYYSLQNKTCFNLALIAEKAIERYAVKYHKQNIIGGKIMALKITPNTAINWILNKPKEMKWIYLSDFVKDYYNGKVLVKLTNGHNKKELDDLFNSIH